MNQRQTEARQEHDKTPAEASALLSRRRMLRRSLGVATPVVATLASGPVSAGACLQPSGFASLATFNSRHPSGMNNCSGKSNTIWHGTEPSSWPAGVVKVDIPGTPVKPSTKFNAIFGSGGITALTVNSNTDPSLDDVLALTFGVGGPINVAPGIVALWLDAKAGLAGSPAVWTTADIVTIWVNVHTNGGVYKPASGKIWTAQQTVDWITRSWT